MKTLTDNLDYYFSIIVRYSKTSHNGYCQCFTCERVFKVTKMDAGHFAGRSNKLTRWSMLNVQPQCQQCNKQKDGMKKVFAERIDSTYGKGTAAKLKQLAAMDWKDSGETWQDLKDRLVSFKAQARKLLAEVKTY